MQKYYCLHCGDFLFYFTVLEYPPSETERERENGRRGREERRREGREREGKEGKS
jgi:hypothetical protein